KFGSYGMLAVKIRFDDAKQAHELPLGAVGTVAIYTDFGKPFHCISKVALRIKKWLYFLPLPTKWLSCGNAHCQAHGQPSVGSGAGETPACRRSLLATCPHSCWATVAGRWSEQLHRSHPSP